MNVRLNAILFVVLAVFLVILLIVVLNEDEKKPQTDVLTQELAAAGVKADGIDSVEFERPGIGTLLIVRTNKERNTWEIQKPIVAPADASLVGRVIDSLLKAKPTRYNELSSNPAVHGLDPPSLKVTLRQGTERSSTVNLGDVTLGDKGVVFVTTSAQPARPMAVLRADLDALFRGSETGGGTAGAMAKWTSDYRSHSIFPADSRAMGEDVTSLKLDLPNKKKELALSRAPSGGWKIDSPAGWGDADSEGDPTGMPNSFTGVNPLIRTLANMSASSAGDFIDQPKDLKEYGLNPDNPDRIRVEMKTKDGKTAVVYIGKIEAGAAPPPPPKMPGMPPMPPVGGVAYVMIEGQPGVIRATASSNLSGLVPIITDPSPLRDRNLITLDGRKSVDGMDIVLAGQPADKPTKLRLVGPNWMLYGGPGDPQRAAAIPVRRIVDVVTAKRTIKDFPAPNPAHFAAIAATLYVWVDGFNQPPPTDTKVEPVKKGEPIKLEFGSKEGDTIYVRRTRSGGQVNEFALPTMLKIATGETVDVLAAVSKTRLDLLDPSLPTFSSDAALKLTVTGQNNYTLEKSEKPDPSTGERLWHFAAPEPKGRTADTNAVEELLMLLGTTQSVTRYVDEQPTPQQLAEYGFAPAPRLKAVVGLIGQERVYEFGKDAADPAFVYARVGGKAAVFTLPRLVFDRLANPDLRDRVVFRDVPVKQVNEVELTGWGGITLKFQKNKDGVWTPQPPTPPTFVVDPTKVNLFLELLGRTRVKTFEKGPPEGKHGFGDPKQNLQVILRWPGGAISLNIGASPDNGATYYGSSAWLDQKNPVFTIDGAAFKPFKESAAGFAK